MPTRELTFTQPTGAALNPQTIGVWLRLTLDSRSQWRTVSSNPLSGFEASLYPGQGYSWPPGGTWALRAFNEVQGKVRF